MPPGGWTPRPSLLPSLSPPCPEYPESTALSPTHQDLSPAHLDLAVSLLRWQRAFWGYSRQRCLGAPRAGVGKNLCSEWSMFPNGQ